MGTGAMQRLKLFYLVKILQRDTDEEHPLSATELSARLAEYGINAERKAIYHDIEALSIYGYDIIKTRTPKSGYFLGARDFETPEIFLLQDAVRTAKFISAKKSRELVSKLDEMLSRYQSRRNSNGIYIDSHGKCKNEEIFYTIDSIQRAIENGHKITFNYVVRELGPDRSIVNKEKVFKVSPYALTWQDDHYYLIGNNEKYDNLFHPRIDRMHSVLETEEPVRHYSEVSKYTDFFDTADYTKQLFSMFGGETELVEFCCDKSILEQIFDRFGDGIFITNVTDTHFCFSAELSISNALVTHIMNYGEKIEIRSPERLKQMIKSRAEEILKLYS